MQNRKRAEGRHSHLYTNLNPPHLGRFHECFYCGEIATCRDHIPPISRVDDYRSLGMLHEVYVKVPCCSECNAALSDSLQETVVGRIEFCKDLLAKKYRKHLGSSQAEWEEDEVKELGPRLRSKVRSHMNRRKYAEDRVNYYDGMDWYLMQLQIHHKRDEDF